MIHTSSKPPDSFNRFLGPEPKKSMSQNKPRDSEVQFKQIAKPAISRFQGKKPVVALSICTHEKPQPKLSIVERLSTFNKYHCGSLSEKKLSKKHLRHINRICHQVQKFHPVQKIAHLIFRLRLPTSQNWVSFGLLCVISGWVS